jgi:chromosome segregation ATPase
MKSNRLIWIISGLIVIFGVAVSAQIFALFGKLKSRERTIRLLSAEIRRKSNPPVRADLTSVGGGSIVSRLKLRSKDKEINELATNLVLRGGELDSVRKELGSREKMVQTLKRSLAAGEKKRRRLLDGKKALETEMVTLRARNASELRKKDAALAALARKNKALLESIENLKEDAENLKAQKKKLTQPKIPKEFKERIRDFGAK